MHRQDFVGTKQPARRVVSVRMYGGLKKALFQKVQCDNCFPKPESVCKKWGIMRIWDPSPGMAIRIVKAFRDCTGNEFTKDSILHFQRRNYLPYHSGHTVFFQEATMSLCVVDDTGEIVENSGNQYFEVHKG
jgi:Domain of unknown function (DUF3601)